MPQAGTTEEDAFSRRAGLALPSTHSIGRASPCPIGNPTQLAWTPMFPKHPRSQSQPASWQAWRTRLKKRSQIRATRRRQNEPSSSRVAGKDEPNSVAFGSFYGGRSYPSSREQTKPFRTRFEKTNPVRRNSVRPAGGLADRNTFRPEGGSQLVFFSGLSEVSARIRTSSSMTAGDPARADQSHLRMAPVSALVAI